jgi:hypothetical protein
MAEISVERRMTGYEDDCGGSHGFNRGIGRSGARSRAGGFTRNYGLSGQRFGSRHGESIRKSDRSQDVRRYWGDRPLANRGPLPGGCDPR